MWLQKHLDFLPRDVSGLADSLPPTASESDSPGGSGLFTVLRCFERNVYGVVLITSVQVGYEIRTHRVLQPVRLVVARSSLRSPGTGWSLPVLLLSSTIVPLEEIGTNCRRAHRGPAGRDCGTHPGHRFLDRAGLRCCAGRHSHYRSSTFDGPTNDAGLR